MRRGYIKARKWMLYGKMFQEAEVARKRGEELLSMISLDAITYHIFELPPISYEEYIQIFGRANTKQVSLI